MCVMNAFPWPLSANHPGRNPRRDAAVRRRLASKHRGVLRNLTSCGRNQGWNPGMRNFAAPVVRRCLRLMNGCARAVRWVIASLFLPAVAVAVSVVFFRARAPEQRIPGPAAAQAPARPLGGEAAPIVVPPLDQSDGVVADLVRKLSSRPQVAAWLATKGCACAESATPLRIRATKR